MRHLHPGLLGVCLFAVMLPASAQAQSSIATDEPAERPRFNFGPLGLTPKLAIRDIGVDTNVFRTAVEPAHDFTATLGPGVDATLRLGRARLRLDSQLEWIYFRTFDQQRSFNFSELGRIDVDMVHVAPFVRGEYTQTRQQPTPEIDVRVQQLRTLGGGGVAIRISPTFSIEPEMTVSTLDLEDEGLLFSTLADALNRRTQTMSVAGSWRVTPLTTFVVRGEALRDTFDRNPLRDSQSFSVLPGLELKPLALISGHAFVGVTRFVPDAAELPDYTGMVADVAVSWIIRDLTRFNVRVNRNVEYSFEATEPYFLLTELSVDVMQALGYQWDVVGRAGTSRLAYQRISVAGSTVESDRTDWLDLYGGGIGRRLGDNVRIGFDVDRVGRRSPLAFREYQGFRIGGSFTYGY
jgi:hypothetical protein